MKENNCGCSGNQNIQCSDDSIEYRICKLEKKIVCLKKTILTLSTGIATQQMEIDLLNTKVATLANDVKLLQASITSINLKLSSLEMRFDLLSEQVVILGNRVNNLEVGSFAQFQLVLLDNTAQSTRFVFNNRILSSPDNNITIVPVPTLNSRRIQISKPGVYRLNYSLNLITPNVVPPENIIFNIVPHLITDSGNETKLDFSVDGRLAASAGLNGIYHASTSGLINITTANTQLALRITRTVGLTQTLNTQFGSILTMERVANAV